MTLLKIKNIIQDFLGISIVKKIFILINLIIFFLFSKLKILSAFLLSFVTFSFLREQNAVASGIFKYYKNAISKNDINWALIRRNTHRLEKGLILRPRKKIFALNYIQETVEEFSKIKPKMENHTTKWCNDVLNEYFKSVSLTKKTEYLKKIFIEHSKLLNFESLKDQLDQRYDLNENYSPYVRSNQTSKINYEDFLSLSKKRRSVRYFEDKKVNKDLIDKALLIARQSPSACNRLPYKYIIFNNKKDASEVASIPFGTLGYSEQIPCVAVLVGNMSYFPSSRDRHIIYVDSSLSAMSFFYALETLGLSSCPINWPDFGPLETKIAKRLKLKKYERVIMLIAIGYPDKNTPVPYSKKKC